MSCTHCCRRHYILHAFLAGTALYNTGTTPGTSTYTLPTTPIPWRYYVQKTIKINTFKNTYDTKYVIFIKSMEILNISSHGLVQVHNNMVRLNQNNEAVRYRHLSALLRRTFRNVTELLVISKCSQHWLPVQDFEDCVS